MSFELFDLISLVTILLGLAATYWKIVGRLSITEHKVETLETEMLEHEKMYIKDRDYIHNKMNRKLESIEKELKNLAVALAALKGSVKDK